jgi:ABC-type multidrug transport system fused ATPase/permease subunit
MNLKSHIDLDAIILEAVSEYKFAIITSFILFTIGLILVYIVFPNYYSSLISDITDGKLNSFGFKDVFIAILPYIVSEILVYFSDLIDTYFFPKIEFLIIKKLSTQVFNSVKSNNIPINTTELVLNLKKVFDLRSIYHLAIVYIMPMLLLSITLAVYFWNANQRLGMLSTVILIMTFVALVYMSKDCTNKSQQNEQKITTYCDDINDIFINIDSVISSGMHKKEVNRIEENGYKLHDGFVSRESCNSNLKFTAAMMYFGVMIGLNGMSLKLFYENAFSKQSLLTIFFMVLNLVHNCDSMIYEMHNITQGIGNYAEMKNYFSQFKMTNETTNMIKQQISQGAIYFDNITIYHDSKEILHNVNCEIKGFEKTALLGNIGTGKTTLIKALLGLLKYKGDIYIDGNNIKDLGSEFISKNIAYIQQNPKLFNRTILENLSYGTNYSENEIVNILKQYDVFNFFMQFENGLNSNVGKNGDKLSGGQRQLVFILRTIIQNKKIILFDEPTSSLDDVYKNTLFRILNSQVDKTIVIITHDKEILHYFDTILLLKDNQIKIVNMY